MITQFRVQNYKALRDVTLDLTPIHVLIGPNDSGKTSILEALAALCRSVDHPLAEAFVGSWEGSELVWRDASEHQVTLSVNLDTNEEVFQYGLVVEFDVKPNSVVCRDEWIEAGEYKWRFAPTFRDSSIFNDKEPGDLDGRGPFWGYSTSKGLRALMSGVHFYRFDPQMLALPVVLDSELQYRMEHSGFGLPLLLDKLLSDDREGFIELENHFRNIFPEIEKIKLRYENAFDSLKASGRSIPTKTNNDGKGLCFGFVGVMEDIPASQVSDGVLLVLAYLAILYLPKPPRLLLIEEPENGIHPQRLREVLRILRDIVKKQSYTQVILTTHSPYAVDEFKPEEVTICVKQNDGSVAVKRLSDSDAVQKQIDIFTLGEIWTAEGDEALVKPETVSEENAG